MKTQTFTQEYDSDEVVVETKGDPVTIDKLFGPASVCRVKVVLELHTEQWVVLREVFLGDEDESKPTMGWVEAARFSASTEH